ncbi:hypothetical protein HanRHA438_Chr14g0681241 [Helianthus annuus]|nr:hypothetical protein HanIR_Chr14g0726851 [Helianthus annuus]KAJ0856163.1 hypothetical protein HanRHA438_Chr14g0681241 [Helianthus annuus]
MRPCVPFYLMYDCPSCSTIRYSLLDAYWPTALPLVSYILVRCLLALLTSARPRMYPLLSTQGQGSEVFNLRS